MTPFDQWYSTHIAPKLEPVLKSLPTPAREQLRKSSREEMAACWNAGLEYGSVEAAAMRKAVLDHYGANLPDHLKVFLWERLAVIRIARVTL